MRTRYNTQANFGFLVVPIIVQGAGMAFFFVPLISPGAVGTLPRPGARGFRIVEFRANSVGQFRHLHRNDRVGQPCHPASRAAHRVRQRLEPRHPPVPADIAGGGLSAPQANAAIDRSIEVQAHLLAANDLFWVSAILFVLLIGVIWLARP